MKSMTRLDYAIRCSCGNIYSPIGFESLDYLRVEKISEYVGYAVFQCVTGCEVKVHVRTKPPVRFLSYHEKGQI